MLRAMALRLLSVFAHPDDETSSSAGTMAGIIATGGDVQVISATRGELGTLGTGDLQVTREELPTVREQELRTVLRTYGVQHDPVFLGHRDQEVVNAPVENVAAQVLEVMRAFDPDIVLTFGPLGISRHEDHIAIHHAARLAFYEHLGSRRSGPEPRLLYVALSPDFSDFDFDLRGPDASPNVFVDVADYWQLKSGGLRLYRSQQDAQEFASYLEANFSACETFHQAYPPLVAGEIRLGL